MEKPPSPQPYLNGLFPGIFPFGSLGALLYPLVPIRRGMPPEEGLTIEQMFEEVLVTFPLTCVDEAIARELLARMVTAELYRDQDLQAAGLGSLPAAVRVFRRCRIGDGRGASAPSGSTGMP